MAMSKAKVSWTMHSTQDTGIPRLLPNFLMSCPALSARRDNLCKSKLVRKQACASAKMLAGWTWLQHTHARGYKPVVNKEL